MRSSFPRVLVILLTAALITAAALVLAFAGTLQYLGPEIPAAAQLREIRVQLPLQVRSRDDKLIAQFGEQRRIPLRHEEIPQVVMDAFLAAEDARFYSHPGVDWQGLVRALLSNVAAGGVREGGGTITMQLARNTVLSFYHTAWPSSPPAPGALSVTPTLPPGPAPYNAVPSVFPIDRYPFT